MKREEKARSGVGKEVVLEASKPAELLQGTVIVHVYSWDTKRSDKQCLDHVQSTL